MCLKAVLRQKLWRKINIEKYKTALIQEASKLGTFEYPRSFWYGIYLYRTTWTPCNAPCSTGKQTVVSTRCAERPPFPRSAGTDTLVERGRALSSLSSERRAFPHLNARALRRPPQYTAIIILLTYYSPSRHRSTSCWASSGYAALPLRRSSSAARCTKSIINRRERGQQHLSLSPHLSRRRSRLTARDHGASRACCPATRGGVPED